MKVLPNMPAAMAPAAQQTALRDSARQIETLFLAEMLKPMGANRPSDSFSGGIGEEQFSTFLQQEEARAVVKAGGIGLSERIFHALARQSDPEGRHDR